MRLKATMPKAERNSMKAFKTWREAHNFACDEATAIGLPHGIGRCRLSGEWTVRIVPRNPDGTESRLQQVMPCTPKTSENTQSLTKSKGGDFWRRLAKVGGGRMITSIERGKYGQWIITAEVGGCFVSEQYYFMPKAAAIRSAKAGLRAGVFGKASS